MGGFGVPNVGNQLNDLIDGKLPNGVWIADPSDPKNGPKGETSRQNIIIGSHVLGDDLFGPETLLHEYGHWQAGILGNRFFNLMERIGRDGASNPAKIGNVVLNALGNLSPQQLSELRSACEKEVGGCKQ